MTKNQKLEAIRKAVIMACHPECETYEGALEKDYAAYTDYVPGSITLLSDNKITIGRVMAAMNKIEEFGYYEMLGDGRWQLLKEDGSEATLEDQTEEVWDELYSLICK